MIVVVVACVYVYVGMFAVFALTWEHFIGVKSTIFQNREQ